MARRNRRKASKKTKRETFVRPTDEREAQNPTRSAGPARQLIPVIETLRNRNQITESQYYALHHYRQTALQAQDDARQSSTLDPERIMGGNTGGGFASTIPAGVAITPAQHEYSRLSYIIGNLEPLVQAVAVDDMTLNRWCIQQYGGKEETQGGKVVAIRPIGGSGKVKAEIKRLQDAAGIIADSTLT